MKRSTEIKANNAVATWTDIEAEKLRLNAALFRQDMDAVDAIRQRTHALIDAYFDIQSEVVIACLMETNR